MVAPTHQMERQPCTLQSLLRKTLHRMGKATSGACTLPRLSLSKAIELLACQAALEIESKALKVRVNGSVEKCIRCPYAKQRADRHDLLLFAKVQRTV